MSRKRLQKSPPPDEGQRAQTHDMTEGDYLNGGGCAQSVNALHQFSVSPFDPQVSVIKGRSQSIGDISLVRIIEIVRSEKYVADVSAVRAAIGNKEAHEEAKGRLPAFTASGVFPLNESISGRKPEPHNGAIQIDCDGKNNDAVLGSPDKLEAMRLRLKNDPHICGGYISPSGNGLKLFARIPASLDTHESSFRALEAYFKNNYGLIADPSTKNPNRLCYLSADPDAWFNPRAIEFAEKISSKVITPALKSVSSELFSVEEIRRALSFIPARPAYEKWMRIANAVRAAVGVSAAEELLREWSPEERPGEYPAKMEELDLVTVGTLFFIAREHGWHPEIYYDNKADRYFARADTDEFRSYTIQHARGVLRKFHTEKDELDNALQHLRETAFIDYALNVSGKPRGLHVMGGRKVLVPKGPTYITPVPGDWSVTRAIFAGMFGGEGQQYQWFIRWLAFSLQSFYERKWQQAQVIALIGPPATGKSLLQSLITAYLGGSVANVFQKATGGTEFNGDWAEATHLCVEDEFAENSRTIRARVQQLVKSVAVNKRHRIHPKGKDAFDIEPFWRMTISCNPEPDSLAVLPLLDSSVRDKISLLWTTPFQMPMPASSAREKDALWSSLMAEAPAMIYDLLALRDVPEELRDPAGRFDLRSFQHPDAMDQIEDLTPEGELFDAILETVYSKSELCVQCDAKELLTDLRLADFVGRWNWLNERKLGRRLTSFAGTWPDRIKALTEGGSRGKRYQISVPAFDII